MTRIKLIACFAAAAALSACSAQVDSNPPAEALNRAAVHTPKVVRTEDNPAGEKLWTYQPLMEIKRCEIGAFTYDGQTYLVASATNYSACAIAAVPE